MTARPLLIDLFCKAGGAGQGYEAAGFDVIGMDIKPQPRYPFEFKQMDALQFLTYLGAVKNPYYNGRRVAAIHASPPCQFGTSLRHAPGGKAHDNLIPETRRLLGLIDVAHVIENVDSNAVRPHMPGAVMLCGSMFGLGMSDAGRWHQLQRHRLFTANWALNAPRPCHHTTDPVIGVYGAHARRRAHSAGGRGTRDLWERGGAKAASQAMGIDWMTLDEMSEAVPPAYTAWIGRQMMEVI